MKSFIQATSKAEELDYIEMFMWYDIPFIIDKVFIYYNKSDIKALANLVVLYSDKERVAKLLQA